MSSEVRARIEAANREFAAAFERADAAALAAMYTRDAALLPANSDFVRGTDAIRTFWQGAFQLGLTGAALETAEVDVQGSTAIEVGRYTLFAPAGAIADAGKYVVIWKNDSGRWKLHRDIWTTSQPAAVAASA